MTLFQKFGCGLLVAASLSLPAFAESAKDVQSDPCAVGGSATTADGKPIDCNAAALKKSGLTKPAPAFGGYGTTRY